MKVVRFILLTICICAGMVMVGIWWHLLGTICQSPAVANAATKNVISYNCHGSIVFITPLQNAALDWLMAPFVFVLLVGNLLRKWQPT